MNSCKLLWLLEVVNRLILSTVIEVSKLKLLVKILYGSLIVSYRLVITVSGYLDIRSCYVKRKCGLTVSKLVTES